MEEAVNWGVSYTKTRLGHVPRVTIALSVCSRRDLLLSIDKGLDVKFKAESVSFRNSHTFQCDSVD